MENRKILKSQKNVFWEAAIIAIFIFGLGILSGLYIENSRTEKISNLYLQSEINLLDIEIQSRLLDLENTDCNEAINKNIEFGDQIFTDAKVLQKYEDASRMSASLEAQHRRYDLLRTLFWVNSIKIKQRCNASFHTLVYLYNYGAEDIEEVSEQGIFSRFLTQLKDEKGNKVILIPIAKNMDLSSLEILLSNYELGRTSIILDENLVVSNLSDLEQIKQALEN
tara:strand:+ start:1487 stop:2158 length:672 start_codon:yes stop_codon:yes gene_type:complete